MSLVKVAVGRLTEMKTVEVDACTTISEALAVGGFRKGDGEEVRDLNNNNYTGSETVEEGVGYYLVERTKSGQ